MCSSFLLLSHSFFLSDSSFFSLSFYLDLSRYRDYTRLKQNGMFGEAKAVRVTLFREAVRRHAVIIATCVGSGHELLDEMVFPRVIIDEGAQSIGKICNETYSHSYVFHTCLRVSISLSRRIDTCLYEHPCIRCSLCLCL